MSDTAPLSAAAPAPELFSVSKGVDFYTFRLGTGSPNRLAYSRI